MPAASGTRSQEAGSRSRGPSSYYRKAAKGLNRHRRNCRTTGHERQDLGAPAGATGRKLQRLVGPHAIQCSDALPTGSGHASHPGGVPCRFHRTGSARSSLQTLDEANTSKMPTKAAVRDVNQTHSHTRTEDVDCDNPLVALVVNDLSSYVNARTTTA